MARPRKAGKRDKNGRLSRKVDDVEARTFQESPAQTVLQARLRHKTGAATVGPVTKDQVKAHSLDKRGSVLGNLLADRVITASQHAAGEDFCERYTRYAALNGIPRATAQGAAYGEVRGSNGGDMTQAAIKARKLHMHDMALLACYGKHVRKAVFDACVLDEPVNNDLLRVGLKALGG